MDLPKILVLTVCRPRRTTRTCETGNAWGGPMPNCTRVCKPLHLSDPSVLDLDGCTEATQAEGASCRVGCPAHMLGNASLQRCVGPCSPFGVLL